METVNIDPDEIVELTNRLIEIHRKWIIEGVGDSEDMKNEDSGLSEQQVAIDEFAAQRGLPDSVRSKMFAAIRQFLVGGPTGDGDGPLVEDVSENLYRAFAVKLSDVIAAGHDLREVFASFRDITRELHTALHRLGADVELLSIVSSWRNTLSDTDVLTMLGEYNATARVLHGPE